MSCHGDSSPEGTDPAMRKTCSSRPIKWVVGAIFIGLGGYYLWMQHRAHVLQYWPVAIFLVCPFMHFGGHGGHGKGKDHSEHGGHEQHEKGGDAK